MKTIIANLMLLFVLSSCESVNKNEFIHKKSETIQLETFLNGDSLILTINEKDSIIVQRTFYNLPTYKMKILNDTIKIKTFYKRQLWDSINKEWVFGLSGLMQLEYIEQSKNYKERIYFLDGFNDITKECIESTISEYYQRKSDNLQVDSLLSYRIAYCALAGTGGRYNNSNSEKAYQILLELAQDNSNNNIEISSKPLEFYRKFEKLKTTEESIFGYQFYNQIKF